MGEQHLRRLLVSSLRAMQVGHTVAMCEGIQELRHQLYVRGFKDIGYVGDDQSIDHDGYDLVMVGTQQSTDEGWDADGRPTAEWPR